MAVKFKEMTMGEMDQKFESAKTSYVKTMTLKEGDNVVRILPAIEGVADDVFYRADLHWNIMLDGRVQVVECLKTKGQKKCPICEDSMAHFSIKDKDTAKKLMAKSAYLWNVLTKDGQVRVLSVDEKCFKAIQAKRESIKAEWPTPIEMWDVKQGMWITITKAKKETAGQPKEYWPTEYTIVAPPREAVPITDELAEDIAPKMAQLSQVNRTWSYDELAAKYFGVSPQQDEIKVQPFSAPASSPEVAVAIPEPATPSEPAATAAPSGVNELDQYMQSNLGM